MSANAMTKESNEILTQDAADKGAGSSCMARLVRLLPADREQAAFEEWLESTRPSGDAESIRRQWESHWKRQAGGNH